MQSAQRPRRKKKATTTTAQVNSHPRAPNRDAEKKIEKTKKDLAHESRAQSIASCRWLDAQLRGADAAIRQETARWLTEAKPLQIVAEYAAAFITGLLLDDWAGPRQLPAGMIQAPGDETEQDKDHIQRWRHGRGVAGRVFTPYWGLSVRVWAPSIEVTGPRRLGYSIWSIPNPLPKPEPLGVAVMVLPHLGEKRGLAELPFGWIKGSKEYKMRARAPGELPRFAAVQVIKPGQVVMRNEEGKGVEARAWTLHLKCFSDLGEPGCWHGLIPLVHETSVRLELAHAHPSGGAAVVLSSPTVDRRSVIFLDLTVAHGQTPPASTQSQSGYDWYPLFCQDEKTKEQLRIGFRVRGILPLPNSGALWTCNDKHVAVADLEAAEPVLQLYELPQDTKWFTALESLALTPELAALKPESLGLTSAGLVAFGAPTAESQDAANTRAFMEEANTGRTFGMCLNGGAGSFWKG